MLIYPCSLLFLLIFTLRFFYWAAFAWPSNRRKANNFLVICPWHDIMEAGPNLLVSFKSVRKTDRLSDKRVRIPFLKWLAGGLRHFNDVTEWGTPWLRANVRRTGRGEASPVRNFLKWPGREPWNERKGLRTLWDCLRNLFGRYNVHSFERC